LEQLIPHLGVVASKYLVAFVLLGGIALVGLLARWLGARAWRASYADLETTTLERSRGKQKKKARTKTRRRGAGELPDGIKGRVTRVIDGDTFDIDLPGRDSVRVRVLGLDTPEKRRGEKVTKDARRAGTSVTAQIALGEDASTRAKKLLEGKKVSLESGRDDRGPRLDVYGRFLAYVRLSDGRDFGLVMIKEGRGECFGWKYPHPRMQKYQRAQR